jgi:hypothetical protein
MRSPIARALASPRRPGRHRRWWWLLAVALLALACGRLLPVMAAGGQSAGSAATIVNPCTGEAIALRESAHLLPHIAPDQAGSREVSVNAVGLSGVGSRGTYYLPMGTSKIVLTLGNGAIDLAAGSDLELVGRGNQGHDFLFHSLAHLKLSTTGGLRGSGVTVQARCE